jgi:hypothetical protein
MSCPTNKPEFEPFLWERRAYGGSPQNDYVLTASGTWVAFVTTTTEGGWIVFLNRHRGLEKSKLVRCSNFESAVSGVEQWAVKYRDRLLHEVKQMERHKPRGQAAHQSAL